MNKLLVTGTISKPPESKTYGPESKPVKVFEVESRNPFSKYPDRVTCSVFGKRMDDLPQFAVGTLVSVAGRARCSAYVSQKTGKPVAILECSVDDVEVLADAQARPATTAPDTYTYTTRTTAPAPQTTLTDGDGVPF